MQQLQPLSLDRLRKLFDQRGWEYREPTQYNSLITAFSGIGFEMKLVDTSLHFVSTVSIDAVDASRFDEVLTWCEDYNNAHAFPSLVVMKDEKRDVSALGVAYVMPGYWEYSDQQFADHVSSAIHGITTSVRDFLSTFAPSALERLGTPPSEEK